MTLALGGFADTSEAACHPQFMGWGKQHPNSGTCDGDGQMWGRVYDQVTDGLCVSQKFKDGGVLYTAGTSCVTGGSASYAFFDQTGNQSSHSHVVRSPWQPLTSYIWQLGY